MKSSEPRVFSSLVEPGGMLRRGRITRSSTPSARRSSREEKPIRAMARCLEPSTGLLCTQGFCQKFTALLTWLFENRQSGDYDVLPGVTEPEARPDVADAQRIVEAIRRFLNPPPEVSDEVL
jgi:hypothetical protein